MSEKAIGLSAAAATALYAPEETIGAVKSVADGVQGVLQYTGDAVNNVVQSVTGAKIGATAPFIPLAAEAYGGATIGKYLAEKTGFNSKWGSAIGMTGMGLWALSNPLVGSLAMGVTGYKVGKYTLGKTVDGLKWAGNTLRPANNTNFKPKEKAA